MSAAIRLIAFTGAFLLLLPSSNANPSKDMAEINVLIVPFISHILGIIGSVYLATQLYTMAERASRTWKYLGLSIVLFSLWNIIMALNIMFRVLYNESVTFLNTSYNIIYFIKVIDPVLVAVTFFVFFYGMRKVADEMHRKPWAVFSKEDSNE